VTAKRETERVLPAEPRAQGDIIRIEHAGPSGEPVLGVVINADCDLANGKLDGVIAYLPMYPFKDYIARFWAPGHVAEVLSSATNKVIEILGDEGTAAESLHAWITTDGAEAVGTTLAKSPKLKRGKAESVAHEVRRLAIALDEGVDPFSRFLSLCRAEQDAQTYARRHLGAARKAMGEGHFQISDLVEHPEIGFVIRMRRIYIISEEQCFRSTAEQRARSGGTDVTAVRIGRLTELYRFKVAQLFAQQFSRIGLPDDVTALGSLAIDDIAAQVEKDRK
jgi:hypothetical protein